MWFKWMCLFRLTEVEPQLKHLDHYLQSRPTVGLKDQCFSFVMTLDSVINMIRCVDCLNAKKKSLTTSCNSQEITKEHCTVSISNILMVSHLFNIVAC